MSSAALTGVQRQVLVAVVAGGLVAGVAAAWWFLRPSAPMFLTTDVTGAPLGGAIEMRDHQGQSRTLDDFRGKVVVLTFGFLNCPDVCPTTLALLASVKQALGPDASRVQVLMVTVDPERDNPELLGRYVRAFHPDFLGLHGSKAELEAVARRYRIVYEKRWTSAEHYVMEHSTSMYIHDSQGRLRLLVPHETGAAPIVHDIRQLLR